MNNFTMTKEVDVTFTKEEIFELLADGGYEEIKETILALDLSVGDLAFTTDLIELLIASLNNDAAMEGKVYKLKKKTLKQGA